MSELDGGGVARKLIDAMNAHDLEAVGSLANERIRFLDVATGEEIDGRQQWKDSCGRHLTGYSDLCLELVNLVVADDTAVAEAVAHGTHDGPPAGPPARFRRRAGRSRCSSASCSGSAGERSWTAASTTTR